MRMASSAASTSPMDLPFFEKNKALGRPLSPHLTIYRPQLTSVLSITHRATGAAMTFAISTAAVYSALSVHDFAYNIDLVRSLDLPSVVTLTAKYILAWPLVYHSLNGIRHLVWDSGRALVLKDTYLGGYIVFGLSLVGASLLTLL
ncbi:succinate dehydrogenase cytochrome b subunit [Capsaspora owczarzaki ATCC 30864]|uniref:Succinate dehydrogenase cytochrome b subunit n=2 Tax=Capsaspora owczarzaki (strain ATCC 30864) TaxID=595528 RepID=A0A0D2UB63_CAPO3|nr:succinate dehydrogenase cytochrome b subunit [Capsaspora owczarzaki ATCC 30864]